MGNDKKSNAEVRNKIFELTDKVGCDKTICPSEVARHLWPEDWRLHMDEVRAVSLSMREAGEVEITQKGIPVKNLPITGPIRLRKEADNLG